VSEGEKFWVSSSLENWCVTHGPSVVRAQGKLNLEYFFVYYIWVWNEFGEHGYCMGIVWFCPSRKVHPRTFSMCVLDVQALCLQQTQRSHYRVLWFLGISFCHQASLEVVNSFLFIFLGLVYLILILFVLGTRWWVVSHSSSSLRILPELTL